jgi:hypothetical protein
MSERQKEGNLNSPRRARRKIEQTLEEYQCLNELEALVRLGCDRQHILSSLRSLEAMGEISASKEKSWELLTGMSRRRLRAKASRWLLSAREIERFNQSHLGWFLAVQSEQTYFLSAPELIRRCAATIGKELAFAGPKKRPFLNSFKAALVAYVRETTQDWHDNEVSALIEAVLEHKNYQTEHHSKWRLSHALLIEAARKELNYLPAAPRRSET